jgi:hypothetical protein
VRKTFCDRCGAEQYVFAVENPIRQGVLHYVNDVLVDSWPKEFHDKYASDEDWNFQFEAELCRACCIELAQKLVEFMEAHKS